MFEPRYILDTGPLVAFANASDSHHAWARHVLNSLGETPVTCEIVLAEACYLLSSSRSAVEHMLALPALGLVRVEPVLNKESDSVRLAVMKYWPVMDIADACVVQLAERFPKAAVITTDLRDFTVYRRHRNQPLNLIHP